MQTRKFGSGVRARRRAGKRRGSLAVLLLSTTALVGVSASVMAADTTWDGSTNPNWFDGTNWDTNAVPTAGDNVFITNAGSTPIVGGPGAVANIVTVGDGVTAGLFVLGTGVLTSGGGLAVGANGGTGSVTVTGGGDLVVTAGDTRLGGTINTTGNLTVTGAGSFFQANTSFFIGHGGTGTFTLADGATATTAAIGLGTNPTGVGTALVTGVGTQLNAAANIVVGSLGDGTFTLADGASATATILTVGQDAGSNGTLNLTGGSSMCVGGACGGNVFIATQAGSTGVINIGTGGASGALIAGTIQFGAGTGTLNFNHTNTNYSTFATISGAGTINHIAGVTRYTGDASGFTGLTNISGGSLYVNNTLGGTVNVNGGTLSGVGTLTGALSVNNGGTIAPGNSIGTLNVASITMNAGSTYTVELNNGGFVAGTNNDRINATGTATINGGTVNVTPVNGTDTGTTYTAGTYTILTAAGGVTGTFDNLTDDYAFLNFALSYDANNVFLTSSLAATTFCLSGMTSNQCAAGNGVFSLGSGTLYTAVLNLSNTEAPGALNQLSGEIHASAKTALIEDSHFVRDAALNRIRSAFDSVAASSMPIFAYAPGGLQSAPARTERFAVWGRAFGALGHIDGNGNAAKLDRSSGGVFIGGDGPVADHWRFGAFGGYSHSKFDADARNSSGSSDNYHAGVYGGGEWGAFGLRYGGTYSWHDIDITRSVAFTGFSDRLTAGYRAGTGQVFGEVGYRFGAGGVRYEPFANLAYVSLRTDGFTETGGAAALVAAGESTDTTFTTLGLRAETTFLTSQSQTKLRGMLGWRHAFGDVVPASIMTFAAGGSAFTIAGVPIAEDALVLDTGFDVKLTPSAVLGFSYGGQFGSGVTDQSLKANLAVKF